MLRILQMFESMRGPITGENTKTRISLEILLLLILLRSCIVVRIATLGCLPQAPLPSAFWNAALAWSPHAHSSLAASLTGPQCVQRSTPKAFRTHNHSIVSIVRYSWYHHNPRKICLSSDGQTHSTLHRVSKYKLRIVCIRYENYEPTVL